MTKLDAVRVVCALALCRALAGCANGADGVEDGAPPDEHGSLAGSSAQPEVRRVPTDEANGSQVEASAQALTNACQGPGVQLVYGGTSGWGFDVSGKDHSDVIPAAPASGKCGAGHTFSSATVTPGCNVDRLHPEDPTDCRAVVKLHTNAFSGGQCDWAICEAPIPATEETITVLSATYGLNCGAPMGNQTSTLASYCNNTNSCSYSIDYRRIGDPVPNCAKTYEVRYLCTGSSQARQAYAPPEAGFGSVIQLTCN
jgi:hypothetical protein